MLVTYGTDEKCDLTSDLSSLIVKLPVWNWQSDVCATFGYRRTLQLYVLHRLNCPRHTKLLQVVLRSTL